MANVKRTTWNEALTIAKNLQEEYQLPIFAMTRRGNPKVDYYSPASLNPEYDLNISPTQEEGELSKWGSWIGEGVYVEGTVEKISYLQGDMLIPKNTTITSSTLVGDVYIIGKATVEDSRLNGDITLTGEVEIKDSEIKGDVNIYGCRYKASRRETQVINSAIEGNVTLDKPDLLYDTTVRGNITITGMFVTGQRCVFSGNLNLKTQTLKELYGERIHGVSHDGYTPETRELV